MRSWRAVLISAGVTVVGAAVVVAEQVTVQRPRAEVLDEKGSAGEVVDTVALNAKLEVLGREGPWLHVRTESGKTGYVPKAVLERGTNDSELSGSAGSGGVSSIGNTAAGRGWDKEVETYISSKNLDRTGLARMEAMREKCRGQALRDFEKEGGLIAVDGGAAGR